MHLKESLETGKDIYLTGTESSSVNELSSYAYSFITNYKNVIKKNNQTLSNPANGDKDLEFKDQGFTRPVVLVLAPFRNTAFEFVNELILASSLSIIQSRKRFLSEFGSDGPQSENKAHTDGSTENAHQQSIDVTDSKFNNPASSDEFDQTGFEHNDSNESNYDEYDEDKAEGNSSNHFNKNGAKPNIMPENIFKGNIDDCFRLGIRIGNKSVSLYEKFYGSDLIVASPLSLRMLIGSKGDTSKKHDHQFLSSIRLLIILQTDIIQMQNLDHLIHVLEHVNLVPTKMLPSCDFGRIHRLLLEGKGREIRQSILSTQYPTPDLNALWRSFSNASGSIILPIDTSIPTTSADRKLLIVRIDEIDKSANRLKVFEKDILNGIAKASSRRGMCLYVPSYLDYVQIRDLLLNRGDISFKAISEYSSASEIVGARSSFFNRHIRLLLISERLLYFKRLLLRGIDTIFFYAPPTDPSLYDHLISYCIPIDNDSSTDANNCLYASIPEDILALERLVGPEVISAFLRIPAPIRLLVQR